MSEDNGEAGAFAFDGNWREFAPVAFTNLLLTIVTLGIYSFWARSRERRYLWSRTRFIDDQLEWTGTGRELFLGYILALVLFLLPIGLLQLVIQSLILRGQGAIAGILMLGLYLLILWAAGVAIFRALRYRLSRTYWHGIRGGSDDNGFRYGVSFAWRTIVGFLALGLLVPWATVGLSNRRWRAMSFGPLQFDAGASASPLIWRYLLYYLLPILLVIGGGLLAFIFRSSVPEPASAEEAQRALFLVVIVFYLVFFVLFGLIALFYYSAYFREVVDNLTLGELSFGFTARTLDWLKLMAGNIALVVFTLGIGIIFVSYRNWAFFVRHMQAYGEIDLEGLTQSQTRTLGTGEGLLDALDVGAI